MSRKVTERNKYTEEHIQNDEPNSKFSSRGVRRLRVRICRQFQFADAEERISIHGRYRDRRTAVTQPTVRTANANDADERTSEENWHDTIIRDTAAQQANHDCRPLISRRTPA